MGSDITSVTHSHTHTRYLDKVLNDDDDDDYDDRGISIVVMALVMCGMLLSNVAKP